MIGGMDDGYFYRTSDLTPQNRLNQQFILSNSGNPNAADIYQQQISCLINATGSKDSSNFHSVLNFPPNPSTFADLTDLFSLASGRNPSEFPPLPSSANPPADSTPPPPLTSMPPPPQFLAGRQFHVVTNNQVCVPQAYLVASPKPMGPPDQHPIKTGMYQRRNVGLHGGMGGSSPSPASAFSNSKSGSSVLSGDGGSSSLSSGASGTGEFGIENDSARSGEPSMFTRSDSASSSGVSPLGHNRNGRHSSSGRATKFSNSTPSVPSQNGDFTRSTSRQSRLSNVPLTTKRASQDSMAFAEMTTFNGEQNVRNSRDNFYPRHNGPAHTLGRHSDTELQDEIKFSRVDNGNSYSRRPDYSAGDPITPSTSKLPYDSSQNGNRLCDIRTDNEGAPRLNRGPSSVDQNTNGNLGGFETKKHHTNDESSSLDHRVPLHLGALLLSNFSTRPPPSREDSISTSTLNTSSGSADSETFRPIQKSIQMGFAPDPQMRTVVESVEGDQPAQLFPTGFGHPTTLTCCGFDGRGPSIPDIHPNATSGGYFADQIYRSPLPFPVSFPDGPSDSATPHHRYTPSPFREANDSDVNTESNEEESSPAIDQPSTAAGHPHAVYVHVNLGETLSVRVGNEIQHIPGPATVRMVSQNSGLPAPLPLHVPPGHLVQQILDGNGALRHLILSPQQPQLISTAFRHPCLTNSQNGATMNPSLSFLPPQTGGSGPLQPGIIPNFPPVPLSSASNQVPFGPFPSLMSNFPAPANPQLQAIRFARLPGGSPPSLGFNPDFQPIPPSLTSVTTSYFIPEGAGPDLCDNPSGNDSTENPGEEQAKLIDLLSKIQSPSISEVGSRDALVSWVRIDNSDASCGPFPEIEASDFIYEVLVAERNAGGKYKVYFRGTSTEHRISDLKPATDYHVKLRAIVEPCIGSATDPVEFRTKPCRPEKPDSLRFEKKTKTCLTLKWTSAKDNGSRIFAYHLEFDQGHNGSFIEVYRGSDKYCRVTKLSPGTTYKFRLAASNEFGKSEFSENFVATTAGNAPMAPDPPLLVEADPYSLHLAWEKRPGDEDFILQMRDSDPKYGFITRCNGRVLSYICSELRHSQDYFFRLAVSNEDGCSPWSEVVVYRTKPARPGCPGKPYIKGKIHSTSAKVAWDLPHDDGGSPVTSFLLEFFLAGSTEGWAVMYAGSEREYNAHGLLPGRIYHFRVSCASDGGHSEHSDIMSITTLPVAPGPPVGLSLQAKPKPTAIQLKWSPPEFDGGADISAYEVRMVSPDNTSQLLAANMRLTCTVASLLPGRVYHFSVRAHNRAGVGLWSESFPCTTGPGAPESPADLRCSPRSSFSVMVSWAEAQNNGAPITEYRLMQAAKKDSVIFESKPIEDATLSTSSVSAIASQAESQSQALRVRSQSADSSSMDNPFDLDLTDFIQIFAGYQCQFEARNLSPASAYAFKVQAVNSAGVSQFCPICYCRTPSAAPSAVTNAQAEATGTSEVIVTWEQPADNGSPISGYQVDISPASSLPNPIELPQSSTQYTLSGLQPQTSYRIRVLAVNSVGPGVWSSPTRATTFSLPPSPPILELSAVSHNNLKLKWTDAASNREALVYSLEMENKNGSFSPVFEGQVRLHKVPRLSESTQYRFRIRATSPTGGIGCWSEPVTFATSRAPPPAPKYSLKSTELNFSSWQLEWQPTKVNLPAGDKILYSVQLNNIKAATDDFREVYRGSDTSYVLSGLNSGSTYRCRYALIRSWTNADQSAAEIIGQFSQTTTFVTAKKPEENAEKEDVQEVAVLTSQAQLFPNPFSVIRGEAELSERQFAFLSVACLSVAALLVAFLIQWLIS